MAKAKSESQPFLMVVEKGPRLAPATASDAERLDTWPVGRKVNVQFVRNGSRVMERKWWAILGLVVDRCNVPWKTKEQASEAVKLALDIVNMTKTVNGAWMLYPKSLTELDDAELDDAVIRMMDIITEMTGIDPEDLRKEAADVGREPKQPDPAEAPSSSASADADDSRSPAVSSAEAGDSLPPSSAAPASPSLTDAEWLRTAARMLWAATNANGDAEANLELLNTQRLCVADLSANPSQATKDKAGSIYRTCKQVVMREAKPADALKIIANYAGVEPKELEVSP